MRIMVSVFIVAVLVLGASSLKAEEYTSTNEPAQMSTISVKGTVTSVKAEDLPNGIRAELRFTSDDGQAWIYLVSPKAVIKNKDGVEITLAELKSGDKASVDYVIYRLTGRSNRVFEVQAITLQ